MSADVCAADGATLAPIRARGSVRCGVIEGIQGFSVKDDSGQWSGIDVDFCRAVAAAALGDSARVVYVPLRASARFPALYQGSVDVLARNTTWTLLREATLDVQFAGVLFYDTQAFPVRRPGGAQSAADLEGATVCVEKGRSSEIHLRQYSADHQLDIQPLSFDSTAEARNAFLAGRCRAYSADASRLAALCRCRRIRGLLRSFLFYFYT
jgi:general L-amino acid transport system substrate-binding protein